MSYPGVDLALVTGHQCGNVVLHDTDEGVLVRDGGDPRRELRVPHLIGLGLSICSRLIFRIAGTYRECGHGSISR
jgi:hypothetical protein